MITKAEVKLIQQAYLLKWPLLFISGKDVTPEQAEDIIRRNDATFVHGY